MERPQKEQRLTVAQLSEIVETLKQSRNIEIAHLREQKEKSIKQGRDTETVRIEEAKIAEIERKINDIERQIRSAEARLNLAMGQETGGLH